MFYKNSINRIIINIIFKLDFFNTTKEYFDKKNKLIIF